MDKVKKNNHYVPQFYLKSFSNNNKSIGTYLFEQDKYIKEASIKKQAYKDYLYGEDGILENNLMNMEKIWAKTMLNIIKAEKIQLSIEEFSNLTTFILTCEARNLKAADFTNKQVDFLVKKLMAEDPNFEMGEDELNNFELGIKVPNLMPIGAAIKSATLMYDLECCLLINKTSRQFLTSDNPTIRYNQMYLQKNYDRGYGLVNSGLQIFFPISKNICICFYDSDVYEAPLNKHGNIEITRGKQIDELNKIICLNAYKNIFFNDSVKEYYIKKLIQEISKHMEMDYTEVGEFPSNIGPLIRISSKKIYYKMKLPIFKLKKEYINMKLPEHMGGPVRPWVNYLELLGVD